MALLGRSYTNPIIWQGASSAAPLAPVQHISASGSSAAPSAVFATGPTQGNLLVAAVLSVPGAGGTTITMTSAGWTALTPAGGASRQVRMFWKIAGASESSTVTAACTAGPWVMALCEYLVAAGITVNAPAENAQTNASGTTTTPTVTPSAGLAGLAVSWVGVDVTSTWSAEQINASSAGVNTEETPTRASASAALFDLGVSSTSGTYSGVATPGTAALGASAIAVFTAVTGSSFAPSVLVVSPESALPSPSPVLLSRGASVVTVVPFSEPTLLVVSAEPALPSPAAITLAASAADIYFGGVTIATPLAALPAVAAPIVTDGLVAPVVTSGPQSIALIQDGATQLPTVPAPIIALVRPASVPVASVGPIPLIVIPRRRVQRWQTIVTQGFVVVIGGVPHVCTPALVQLDGHVSLLVLDAHTSLLVLDDHNNALTLDC